MMIKDKIKKMPVDELVKRYSLTKTILGLVVLTLISLSLFFIAIDNTVAGYACMALAYIILVYLPYYYSRFSEGVLLILFDELDPIRAIDFWDKTNALKGNVLAVNKGLFYVMMGQFDQGEYWLGQVNTEHIPKNLKATYMYTESLLHLLAHNEFNKKDFDQNIEALALNTKMEKVNQDRGRLLQAIAHLQHEQTDDYFSRISYSHPLDQLIASFYQGKNELLLGNEDKARQLFEEVARKNEEIYFVREAKRYLGEIDEHGKS
ncbi:TPA: tol-pal system YbgF family protein [Streptococcus suis]